MYEPHSQPLSLKVISQVFSFEHMLCHCNNPLNYTPYWSNVLRRAPNVSLHKTILKFFWNEIPSTHASKRLNFVSQLWFYLCLELLKTPKPLFFVLHCINSHSLYIKLFVFPMDIVLMGPQTPQCIISNGSIVSFSSLLPLFATYCLPSVHALQMNVVMGGEVLPRFMSFTMFCGA